MAKRLLLLCCILIPAMLLAKPVNFRFRHLSVENGLASNSVRAITQDHSGFLWIGTDEGLNRYDGTTIKTYTISPEGPGKFISALHATDKELWIGTDEGIYIYTFETSRFKHFDQTISPNIRIKGIINHITEDKEGNIWIATNQQGVFKYIPSKHDMEQYAFSDVSGQIYNILADNENQIWAVSNQGKWGIYKLNKAENKFEPFPLHYSDSHKHDSQALAILEDSEHNLWLGTWECGLHKIDKYSGQTTTYLHPDDTKGITHIHSLMEYAPHQLLIGSDDGLLWFNTITEDYQLFTENETSPYPLSNRFVYPIIKDREGGIWIGTYYGGVNYISPKTDQFECFAHSQYTNSVNGRVIGRFCEDKNGHIWIASDDGGLDCYSPQSQKFTHYNANEGENSLSYHNVHALCLDGDQLWIGTYTGGVNVLNLKTGAFKKYFPSQEPPNGLDGSSSYAIFKDRSEQIWVASMSSIHLYNKEKDNFTCIKTLNALTIDIDQDNKGNLWFSTQGKGLFKYQPEKRIWKKYTHDPARSNSLANDQVNCCLIDRYGTLWAGTMNGLCKYNAEKDDFETIPLDIPSHNICCIIEDQHILWLTTTKGLVRYVPGESCQIFTKNDGLQSDQFLPNAGMKASDGKIYIGSVNGFNAFYPHQIKTNQVIPPVIITELEIFNKTVPVGSKTLPKALNQTEELELSYKDNVFSLLYASLSYCTPAKNQYAYKLEGFDKEWNHVGSQNKATYTNLPAGTYTFKVKACNNDGVWNEQGASLKITIHPPFYWSTAFKLLYFVMFIITLGLFIRLIIKRTEKKHAIEINRLNENKEKEVHAAKIKFFTTIAHEIRTPVSLIIGPLEKIMNSTVTLPSSVREDLNIIDRNSQRLLFLVNQLLDFRKVEEESMKMKFTRQSIYALLKAVCERFQPFINQRGATLEVNYPNEEFTAIIDSEAITKLVSNLLTNASKYTKDQVILTCTVQPAQQTFTIQVTDNGIGISEEDQKKIFNPFFQATDNKPGTGIGLSIVKNIVELHKGQIQVESEKGKGSSFTVTLPIEQAEEQEEDIPSKEMNTQPTILQETIVEFPARPTTKSKPVMLIVDDNQEMLNFLANNFTNRYNILLAEDGIEALEKLKENDVTLIISDWMMPHMNGVELCKAVRANPATSHIPFILLTAKTDVDSKIEGLDCQADAYIEKPFSVQYLEACIKNLITMRNLLRQKFSKMPLVPLNSIANNKIDNQFLTQLNEIIEANFSNPELSVDFLAEKLCISRSGLFAKIKTLANITPNELIQLVRLKKAASLLAENKYRINEICYMVGFSNPSYFTKCFQKQFGMKPGEFINNSSKDILPDILGNQQ